MRSNPLIILAFSTPTREYIARDTKPQLNLKSPNYKLLAVRKFDSISDLRATKSDENICEFYVLINYYGLTIVKQDSIHPYALKFD